MITPVFSFILFEKHRFNRYGGHQPIILRKNLRSAGHPGAQRHLTRVLYVYFHDKAETSPPLRNFCRICDEANRALHRLIGISDRHDFCFLTHSDIRDVRFVDQHLSINTGRIGNRHQRGTGYVGRTGYRRLPHFDIQTGHNTIDRGNDLSLRQIIEHLIQLRVRLGKPFLRGQIINTSQIKLVPQRLIFFLSD